MLDMDIDEHETLHHYYEHKSSVVPTLEELRRYWGEYEQGNLETNS